MWEMHVFFWENGAIQQCYIGEERQDPAAERLRGLAFGK